MLDGRGYKDKYTICTGLSKRRAMPDVVYTRLYMQWVHTHRRPVIASYPLNRRSVQ